MKNNLIKAFFLDGFGPRAHEVPVKPDEDTTRI